MSSVRTLISKRTNPTSLLRTVAIVGGTHGNELAGQYLVQHFENEPELVARPSFKTTCILSNVESIKANRRYVDTDMNRCFDLESLQTARALPAAERNVEQARALEVDDILGNKFSQDPKADMVFDLHNTTSNCGVLLCFHQDDDFAKEVAAYLKQFDPDICTVFWPQADPPFLPTIGRSGMTVEVGPVPHSTVRAAVYQRTKKLLMRALDYVEMHNRHIANPAESSLQKTVVKMPVAERVAQIDYPRDEQGRLTAFIHPDLQGVPELRPQGKITSGHPIFQTLAGETLRLDTSTYSLPANEEFYPMFVNEAAYYEKGVAFYLTRITQHDVAVLAPQAAPKL